VDLQQSKLLDRLVLPAATRHVSAVWDLLEEAGFPDHSGVVESETETVAALEWPPGTPILTVINDLLTAVNYDTLSFTPEGLPVAAPYVSPQDTFPLWEYAVDAASVIRPGIDTTLDLFNVPNVWVGVVSEPDRPPLRSVLRNDDPASALSTVSRGREIVQLIDSSMLHLTEQQDTSGNTIPAATQGDLDKLVERARDESSTVFEQVKMTTGLMPFHGVGNVFSIDYGAGAANYREVSWSMDLAAGGAMVHELRRAVIL
jgi:hypothetical protein